MRLGGGLPDPFPDLAFGHPKGLAARQGGFINRHVDFVTPVAAAHAGISKDGSQFPLEQRRNAPETGGVTYLTLDQPVQKL